METRTISKTRSAVIFSVISIISILITLSFINRGGLLATAADSKPQVYGTCKYGGVGFFGVDVGESHTTLDSCKQKTNWLMFCPDVDGKAVPCDCFNPGTRSPILDAIVASRDGLITSLTDGQELSEQDIANSLKFNWAVTLQCACSVNALDILRPEDESEYVTYESPYGKITGRFELVSAAARTFSRMLKPNFSDKAKHCSGFPVGCRVSSSNRSGSGTSAHDIGAAFDVSCGEKGNLSCGTKTAEVASKGRAGGELNIIRECSSSERQCNKNTDGVQVIHFDIKFNDDSYGNPRPNNPGEPCFFADCNFNCIDPITPPAN